jgi:hypothetical protein
VERVEVHEELYGLVPDLRAEAYAVIAQSRWGEQVAYALLHNALQRQSGLPTDVTKSAHSIKRGEVAQAESE